MAKRHGVSEQTIYTWRKRFGALQASDVKRLRQLEAENARLKKLVAERDLEIEVMKESLQKNGERAGPPATSGVCPRAWGLGAAGLHAALSGAVGVGLSIGKAAKDAPVVTRMQELSAQYPRYGYRRIRIFLDRDGHA